MATTVENPFDTQQPVSNLLPDNTVPNKGIVGGAVQNMTTGTAEKTPGQEYNPNPNLSAQTYTAQTREVDKPTETVQGQVDSILAKDSPLMQRARTMATQQMAQRGLVNTSMNAGAGYAAMVEKATPIATSDATIYSNRALANMDATNVATQFNVGQNNDLLKFGQDVAARYGVQAEQNKFVAGENKIKMDFDERIFKLQEAGLDTRQANDIASREAIVKLQEEGITNRFDQEILLKTNQFNAEQTNEDRRRILDNDAALERLNVQINANRADIPTKFAADVSISAMQSINEVLANKDLKPEAKKVAIDNIKDNRNATLDIGATFYKTPVPPLAPATGSTPAAPASNVVTKPVAVTLGRSSPSNAPVIAKSGPFGVPSYFANPNAAK